MIYVVSKLFTYLILPPGIFIITLLVASFLVKRLKKLFLFVALVFYMLSNSFVADLLLTPLEKPYRDVKIAKDADAVVILGGGHIKNSPNAPLRPDAYKRAIYGIMLANKLNLPILFSGGGLNKTYSEADAFLDVLEEVESAFGVQIRLLKKEGKSLDTFQNAKYSKKIFNELGIHRPKILLVTSAYHMKRSVKLYSKFNFNVIAAPTDFKISLEKKTIWDVFPKFGALKRSYIALHEYFGLLSIYVFH